VVRADIKIVFCGHQLNFINMLKNLINVANQEGWSQEQDQLLAQYPHLFSEMKLKLAIVADGFEKSGLTKTGIQIVLSEELKNNDLDDHTFVEKILKFLCGEKNFNQFTYEEIAPLFENTILQKQTPAILCELYELKEEIKDEGFVSFKKITSALGCYKDFYYKDALLFAKQLIDSGKVKEYGTITLLMGPDCALFTDHYNAALTLGYEESSGCWLDICFGVPNDEMCLQSGYLLFPL
jgi:hypothetical protein